MTKTLQSLDSIKELLDLSDAFDHLKNEEKVNIKIPLEIIYKLNPFNSREVEMIKHCLEFFFDKPGAFDCCVLKIIWTRLADRQLDLEQIYLPITNDTLDSVEDLIVGNLELFEIYCSSIFHHEDDQIFKGGALLCIFYGYIFNKVDYPKA